MQIHDNQIEKNIQFHKLTRYNVQFIGRPCKSSMYLDIREISKLFVKFRDLLKTIDINVNSNKIFEQRFADFEIYKL